VTLGTLDGANVEISQLVGPENISIFGLTADEVMNYYLHGGYIAYDTCHSDPRLETITDQLIDGTLGGRSFYGIHDALLKSNDEYFVLKDFDPYVKAWKELSGIYQDEQRWGKMSLTNIASAGHFTSDRTITQYCEEIWHTPYDKIK
jgi:starch phosphorylase